MQHKETDAMRTSVLSLSGGFAQKFKIECNIDYFCSK